jgi:hypothetical protein
MPEAQLVEDVTTVEDEATVEDMATVEDGATVAGVRRGWTSMDQPPELNIGLSWRIYLAASVGRT